MSLMKAIRRSLSSCFEETRMWRSTERASLDNGVDVTGQQIDARHQGQGAVAFVLVIAHYGGAGAGKWRTVRRGRADRLDPRFLIVRNDGKAPYVTAFWALAVAICSLGAQHRHLTVDAEDFRHLGLELRIAFFQVIAHPRFREGRLLCGLTSCSARILQTV